MVNNGLISWLIMDLIFARKRVCSGMRGLIIAILLLAACTPIEAQRGQIVTDQEISQLKIGTTAKPEVTALLGTPTTVDPFDDKLWYYMGEDTKQIGIHPPVPTQRRVLALRFDDSGTLVEQKLLTKDDGQQIAMAPGETPVVTAQRTMVQQLIGNVGRFSDQGADSKK
jgi:outer membrane protein assembly factor BamE (lipoprotein component of BamABCDE complex)